MCNHGLENLSLVYKIWQISANNGLFLFSETMHCQPTWAKCFVFMLPLFKWSNSQIHDKKVFFLIRNIGKSTDYQIGELLLTKTIVKQNT